MTNTMEVPAGEREVVRVFALDAEPQDIPAYKTPPGGNGAAWPLQEALGADRLDPEHVEVFPAADLSGVGLAGYLTDGLGIEDDAVAKDRARLDAETGHIVILRSRAFGGAAQTLTPKPPLRHLGTYRMAPAEPPRPAIPAASDTPPEVTPTASVPPGPPSRGASLIVLVSILLAAIALLAVVFYFRSQPY